MTCIALKLCLLSFDKCMIITTLPPSMSADNLGPLHPQENRSHRQEFLQLINVSAVMSTVYSFPSIIMDNMDLLPSKANFFWFCFVRGLALLDYPSHPQLSFQGMSLFKY